MGLPSPTLSSRGGEGEKHLTFFRGHIAKLNWLQHTIVFCTRMSMPWLFGFSRLARRERVSRRDSSMELLTPSKSDPLPRLPVNLNGTKKPPLPTSFLRRRGGCFARRFRGESLNGGNGEASMVYWVAD